MKTNLKKLSLIFMAIVMAFGLAGSLGRLEAVRAQVETPMPPEPAVIAKPILTIDSYQVEGGGKNVDPWTPFKLSFTVKNTGEALAKNFVINFSGEDFVSLQGGVATSTVRDILPGEQDTISHPFKVADMSTWKYSGILGAMMTYTDEAGTPYSTTFTFYIGINQQPSGPTRTPTLAPTAKKPLMVVKSYLTDLDPLQPGSQFRLQLTVGNVGSSDAQNISLVYGGTASTTSFNPEGTPQAGGLSGGAGDTTNFAPLGQSNIAQLGSLSVGSDMNTSQEFVVNVTTQPGAYPLKLSFVYTDPNGVRFVDDQIITLMVLSLPQLEVSFYRQPVVVTAGMASQLPIQITNIAKKAVVLGNMTVTAPEGMLENNTALVGSLEAGGYFTLDAMYTAEKEGPVGLNFEIRYTDDFNQLRTYNTTLDINVEPNMAPSMPEPGQPILDEQGNPVLDDKGNPVIMPMPGEMPGGGNQGQGAEVSLLGRIWNAIKSFFGVGTSGNSGGGAEGMPMEPMPGGRGY